MAHILILEPDKQLAGSLKDYFANANHRVSLHNDPQQAVSAADKQVPDIIITELQLAGRSGVEFLYELRSYPDWQTIPVIVFTGLQAQDTTIYFDVFKELGVKACFYKPQTSLNQLLVAVEQNRKTIALKG